MSLSTTERWLRDIRADRVVPERYSTKSGQARFGAVALLVLSAAGTLGVSVALGEL